MYGIQEDDSWQKHYNAVWGVPKEKEQLRPILKGSTGKYGETGRSAGSYGRHARFVLSILKLGEREGFGMAVSTLAS